MGSVLYIGGFELPDKNAAAHHVLNNAKIFTHLGYDVYFSGINTELEWENVGVIENISGYQSCPRPYPKNNKQWICDMVDFSRIKNIIDSIPNIKCIIAYNMHAIPLANLVKYSKKLKIKVISNLTEWYENHLSLNIGETIRCIDNYLAMHFIHKKVDGMMVVSSYLYNYYKKDVKNILIMPPLVDVYDPKWKYKYSIESEKIEFVYAGGIEKGNKKDRLCPILKSFNKIESNYFHFNIVGLTEERLLSEFPEMETVLKQLGNKVTFFGRVSHAKSIRFLLESDYSIFIREKTRKNNAGFPTKFVESWTSGINIIASNVSDIENYLPSVGNNYLLEVNDDCEIERVIQSALTKDIIELRNNRRMGTQNNPFCIDEWYEKVGQFFKNMNIGRK